MSLTTSVVTLSDLLATTLFQLKAKIKKVLLMLLECKLNGAQPFINNHHEGAVVILQI